jgi:hypothetical protein
MDTPLERNIKANKNGNRGILDLIYSLQGRIINEIVQNKKMARNSPVCNGLPGYSKPTTA